MFAGRCARRTPTHRQVDNGAGLRYKRVCSTSTSTSPSSDLVNKLHEVGKTLGIDPNGPLEQWYSISKHDLIKAGVQELESKNISLPQLLSTAFPNHKWYPWLFKHHQVPRYFWNSKQNQRWYLEWLRERLNFQSLEDWYSIKHDHFAQYGGHQLLDLYDGSPFKLLSTIYSEHQWVAWKLDRLPRSWWTDPTNQLAYMEWAAKCLNVKCLEDWYNVSQEKFVMLAKGKSLLAQYNGSLASALLTLYPKHKWEAWRFPVVMKRWWDDPSNQRAFLNHIAAHRGFSDLSDFYKLSKHDIAKYGGSVLLNRYGGSVRRLFAGVFPEHKWESWRFCNTTPGFWTDLGSAETRAAIISLVESIAKKYNISQNNLAKWYSMSVKQFGAGVQKALRQAGGLINALRIAYPDHNWNPKLFLSAHSSGRKESVQHRLYALITEHFKGTAIYHRFVSQKLAYVATTQPIELDIYIRDKNFAIEYQGEGHYFDLVTYGVQHLAEQHDAERRAVCVYMNITLVEIPYWWDGSVEALLNTIHHHRPDLVEEPIGDGLPIPDEPILREKEPLLSMKELKRIAT